MNLKLRLHKLISSYGYTSRRKAEELIKEGRVVVDGILTRELGIKVPDSAIIEVDGTILKRAKRRVYLMLNKPPGYLCSRSDPSGKPLIYDLLPIKYNNLGVYSVGRLDFMSEGLLLCTNDGFFANKLIHPSSCVLKKYIVVTDRKIPYNLIARWQNGTYIKGEKYTIKDYQKLSARKVVLTLAEGKNREIRKLFNSLNIKVIKLKRTSIGFLELDAVPTGNYRELTDEEKVELLNCAG